MHPIDKSRFNLIKANYYNNFVINLNFKGTY